MPFSPTPPHKLPLGTAAALLWGAARGIKHWAPVWIPLLLLWQFTTRGLQPALSESRRLTQVEPEVHARHAEAKSAFEQVQAEAQAWSDPVYWERRRRLRFQEPVWNEQQIQWEEPEGIDGWESTGMEPEWVEDLEGPYLEDSYLEDPYLESLEDPSLEMDDGEISPAQFLENYAEQAGSDAGFDLPENGADAEFASDPNPAQHGDGAFDPYANPSAYSATPPGEQSPEFAPQSANTVDQPQSPYTVD